MLVVALVAGILIPQRNEMIERIASQRLVAALLAISLLLLLGADGGSTCSGEPPGEEIEEILDILRAGDAPGCERDGEGWPLESCPMGCIPGESPSQVIDHENECWLTEDQLGGPSICIPSSQGGRDCTTEEVCWLDQVEERVWLTGDGCYERPPGWSFPLSNCAEISWTSITACESESGDDVDD